MSHFTEILVENGWTEVQFEWIYIKGDWSIQYDTSTWLMIATKNNSRVFDVHNPSELEATWAVNLKEHLCKTDDEINWLKSKL